MEWWQILLNREEELVEDCRALLLIVSLQVDVEDKWLWSLEPSHYKKLVITHEHVPDQTGTCSWCLVRFCIRMQ